MTTIIISKDSTAMYKGFTCFGHAEYAKKGKPDILCSAISGLVINTINSLEELAGEELSVSTNEETGFIKCDFAAPLQEKSVFLLDSMVYGLQNLSKTYGEKYLLVKFEEV
jgi:uncharacterized protein YsxB (DUF464 family)